ncbi:hypothetical protein DB346_15115 [Verrucomicrobia bacterium LW23]|nr:hypothetical protein DB346_15115 [Verrucomicrobia bacterium LW23]
MSRRRTPWFLRSTDRRTKAASRLLADTQTPYIQEVTTSAPAADSAAATPVGDAASAPVCGPAARAVSTQKLAQTAPADMFLSVDDPELAALEAQLAASQPVVSKLFSPRVKRTILLRTRPDTDVA